MGPHLNILIYQLHRYIKYMQNQIKELCLVCACQSNFNVWDLEILMMFFYTAHCIRCVIIGGHRDKWDDIFLDWNFFIFKWHIVQEKKSCGEIPAAPWWLESRRKMPHAMQEMEIQTRCDFVHVIFSIFFIVCYFLMFLFCLPNLVYYFKTCW